MKKWNALTLFLLLCIGGMHSSCTNKVKRNKVTVKDEHYMDYYTSNPSSKK